MPPPGFPGTRLAPIQGICVLSGTGDGHRMVIRPGVDSPVQGRSTQVSGDRFHGGSAATMTMMTLNPMTAPAGR